jgi:hypothetical protein
MEKLIKDLVRMFFEIDDIKRRHSAYYDVTNGMPLIMASLRLDRYPRQQLRIQLPERSWGLFACIRFGTPELTIG